MATKPPAPSNDHDETVILKTPVVGSAPDPFDSDKTVVRKTPAAEPITPKPKGFSMSFDHPEANAGANDLEATVKVASAREMPAAAADPLAKRKPGSAASQSTPLAPTASEATPAKGGGILKWILGGAAAIVVIILGVAYLLGSNELAAPKVTILKQGTLIEPAQPFGAVPAMAPESPLAAPPPAAQAVPPVAPVAPEPAPATAAVVAPPPSTSQAPPVVAAAPAQNVTPTLPGTPNAANAPKAPPTAAVTAAAAAAAAAAKKAALEKERLAKQAQTSAAVVTQAPPPPPPPPPPPVQAAPTPTPAPVAAPRIEAPAAPVAPVAPPAPAAPSNPNQVCEGRWLLALQNCLTEQCAKPAYSKHAVCVERRAMEQRRQEEQQSR